MNRLKIAAMSSSLTFLTFLAGCSDDSSTVPYPETARIANSAPINPIAATMQEVAAMPQQVDPGSIVLADEQVSIRMTKGENGAPNGIVIAKNAPVGFYRPGRYRVDKDGITANDVAFLDQVKKYVNIVKTEFDRSNRRYTIQATFTGTADGLPVHNVTYAGEFGDQISQAITLNNQPAEITIVKGQKINNAQLGYLRALSLDNVVHNLVQGDFQSADSFVINTNPRVGSNWRSVSVVFTLAPAQTGS